MLINNYKKNVMNEIRTSPEKDFLCNFFDLLMEHKVRYAVLRNWETLPYTLDNSDLDLLTDSAVNAKLIIKLARQAAHKFGGEITSIYTVEATIMTLGGRKQDGTWWGLHIDIFPGLTYFGIPYFSASAVLDEAVIVQGKFYRCTALGDVVAFLKECLHNQKTKKDYYHLSQKAFIKNPESVIKASHGYYFNKGEDLLTYLLEKERSGDEIHEISKKLVRELWLKNLFCFKFHRLLFTKAKNIYKRIERIFKPPGYCVAFLGTDGAGKSTIIDTVQPFLTKMMHHNTIYEHMRPNYIPAIAQLFGRPKLEGPTTDPHAGKVSGYLGSFLRILYYSNDYIFGFWLKIYPILIKRPTMVLFDRYFYDYLIDPKRSCINLPPWIIHCIGILIPSPDLIICLGTNPEIIHKRKPELSYSEVSRQVTALKAFCNNENKAIWIDTGCSPEESIDKTFKLITSSMARRYEK